MKNVVVSGLVAGIALFVWGALFWSVLPTANAGFAHLDPEASQALGTQIQAAIDAPGTYLFPDAFLDVDTYQGRHEAGPVAQLFVFPEGRPAMPPSVFVVGFLHLVTACMLAAWLLRMTSSAFRGLGHRFGFVLLLFVFGAVLTDLNGPVWWQNPWPFALVTALFHLTGGVLVAATLAYFVSDNA